MSEVFAVRRGWLRDRCAAAGSAAALVSRPANVRYLAGGAPPGAVLLVGPAEDVLLCPRTPSGDLIEGHLDEQLRLTVLPAPGGDPAVAAADLAQTSGADSLAVEEHHLSVARHRALGSVAPRLLLGDLGARSSSAAWSRTRTRSPACASPPRSPTRPWASSWSRSWSAAPSATSPWNWSAAWSTTARTGPPS